MKFTQQKLIKKCFCNCAKKINFLCILLSFAGVWLIFLLALLIWVKPLKCHRHIETRKLEVAEKRENEKNFHNTFISYRGWKICWSVSSCWLLSREMFESSRLLTKLKLIFERWLRADNLIDKWRWAAETTLKFQKMIQR